MQEQISAECDVGQAHQQLPDQATRAVGVKRHHQVDDAGENDEPGDQRVDRHGRQQWRADGYDPKQN